MPKISDLILIEQGSKNLREARSPLHILVIDDDPLTCKIIHGMFSKNYCVHTCDNVSDGLNEYLHTIPDLIFLDINLADKDFNGFNLLKEIRHRDSDAHIVIISANDSRDNMLDAWINGANGFIAKPFSSRALSNHVENCENYKIHKERTLWT